MHYKNVHKPLPQIARELKVGAVVEAPWCALDRVRIALDSFLGLLINLSKQEGHAA